MSEEHADKVSQFREWVDRAFELPEADHVPGWCQECDSRVEIDTGVRPFGMARSCEEHRPLCQFQEGSAHG